MSNAEVCEAQVIENIFVNKAEEEIEEDENLSSAVALLAAESFSKRGRNSVISPCSDPGARGSWHQHYGPSRGALARCG